MKRHKSVPTRGGRTKSGTEKRCSHDLQSGHPAWWSADNCSIFPKVNILEARIKANRQRKWLKILKKKIIVISCLFVFLAYCICPLVLKIARETKTHTTRLFTDPYFRVRSSRSSAIRYGLSSWILDARPVGIFSILYKSRWPPLTVRRAISRLSEGKIGDITVNSLASDSHCNRIKSTCSIDI